jgi:hypothetical protein
MTVLGIIFQSDKMCKNDLTDISSMIQNVLLRFAKLYYLAK